MILSRSLGFLFIHPPKTGGTAVTQALETVLADGDIVLGDTPGAQRYPAPEGAGGNLWKHARVADLGDLLPNGLRDLTVVVTVRNPFDRLVSFYTWAQSQSFQHPMIEAAHKLTFSGFLHDAGVVEALKNAPYRSYVSDASGERTDVIIRQEHLAEGLACLADRLQVSLPGLERVNTSNRDADYRSYYRSRDVEQVSRVCAVDLADFDYAF